MDSNICYDCDNIFVVIMFFQVRLTLEIGKKWKQGEITDIGDVTPPDQPSRDEKLNVVAPGGLDRFHCIDQLLFKILLW
jgi:hypothetical protein